MTYDGGAPAVPGGPAWSRATLGSATDTDRYLHLSSSERPDNAAWVLRD